MNQQELEDFYNIDGATFALAICVGHVEPIRKTKGKRPKNLYDKKEVGEGIIALYESRRSSFLKKADEWKQRADEIRDIMEAGGEKNVD